LQKQFFPLYFSQSTGRRGTFLSEEQIPNWDEIFRNLSK
jgi:hypothetical protein